MVECNFCKNDVSESECHSGRNTICCQNCFENNDRIIMCGGCDGPECIELAIGYNGAFLCVACENHQESSSVLVVTNLKS